MKLAVELTDKQAAHLLQSLVNSSHTGPILAALVAELDSQARAGKAKPAPKPAAPPKKVVTAKKVTEKAPDAQTRALDELAADLSARSTSKKASKKVASTPKRRRTKKTG